MKQMLFISWISHNRRSQLISNKLDIKLHQIQILKRRYFLAPIRYLLQTIYTLKICIREKPKVVFVQNPPIFAPLAVYFYAKFWKAHLIIDSHTFALLAWWWKWSLPIHAYLSRRAITTIVTNDHLNEMIESWRAPSFILADIPTAFPLGERFIPKGDFNVAVINTFAEDEPVDEVLKAAALLPDVQFYITGDLIKAKKKYLLNCPDNVTFTGFIPDEQYFGLLRAVAVIMVLTNDDHTMQRGACEAVSLGKPIITSNWPLLRNYFNKGTIHVENSSDHIQKGIKTAKDKLEILENEVLDLQRERWIEWEDKYQALRMLIEGI
jgi:glycosyltransferase involved in cell wall biosynthesis